MNRSFHKSQTLRFYDCSAVEVKSKEDSLTNQAIREAVLLEAFLDFKQIRYHCGRCGNHNRHKGGCSYCEPEEQREVLHTFQAQTYPTLL